jgi:hypothetical protein
MTSQGSKLSSNIVPQPSSRTTLSPFLYSVMAGTCENCSQLIESIHQASSSNYWKSHSCGSIANVRASAATCVLCCFYLNVMGTDTLFYNGHPCELKYRARDVGVVRARLTVIHPESSVLGEDFAIFLKNGSCSYLLCC